MGLPVVGDDQDLVRSRTPCEAIIARLESSIADFNVERQTLLSQIAACARGLQPVHALRRQLLTVTAQANDLQQALTKANRDLATERQHAFVQANEMDRCTSPTHRLAKETRVTVRMNHALPSAWTISADGENNPQQATDREAAASCGRSDTDSRSQGHEKHIANQLQELKALVQQMEGTEKALCQATRSCIQAQQARDAASLRAAELSSRLQREEERHQKAQREYEHEMAALRAALFKQNTEHEQALLDATRSHAADLAAQARRGEQASRSLEAALGEARRRNAALEEELAVLKQRRAADVEGWTHDITAHRKRLAALEGALRQASVLERMADDERRDAVLAKHDRLVRQQHAAASGRRRPARSTQEAHAIRAGLLQMAEDLQARLSRMRSGET
ncbi:POC11 [Auxenochlorella protothecoides x Auxenochlorella symbiontica]